THNYYVEVFRSFWGRGVAHVFQEGSSSTSLFFHYLGLLRIIGLGISTENRRRLVDSLCELVKFTSSLPNPDSLVVMGVCSQYGAKSFLRRWRETEEPDMNFQVKDVYLGPPAPFRRIGFYVGLWVMGLAIAAYPFCAYWLGWRFLDAFALAFPLHAA